MITRWNKWILVAKRLYRLEKIPGVLRVNLGPFLRWPGLSVQITFFIRCLIEIDFDVDHIQGLFRWEQQQGWISGVFLFTQLLIEVLLERQCEIMFFVQYISLSFRLSPWCRKPAFIRICLKILVELLSHIFRKYSPHFILSFRVWWMSSYWTQTCMVLKIWLRTALKICYTLWFFGVPKNCAHTCILLLKFQTLGFYPQRCC